MIASAKPEDVAKELEQEAEELMDHSNLDDPNIVYTIEEKLRMAKMLRNINGMPKLKRGRPRKEN